MNESISFKGANNCIILNINTDKLGFDQLKVALADKLATNAGFFPAGTIIQLIDCPLQPHQQAELTALFNQYQLILAITSSDKTNTAAKPVNKANHEDYPIKIINRTLRGGDSITYPGSILINGNINPGAKVIAGGHIDVHGSCRGIVFAGAYGDTSVTITADILLPIQIRIADVIAISPDNADNIKEIHPEQAVIENGMIVFNPFER